MIRVIDVLVSAAALVVLAPVLLVTGVLVRLDSSGPVLFRQQRVGRDGVLFDILKFRTMVPDRARGGPLVTVGDDPRITRVGRFLRSTKLDELPQLFNVLRGQMALIGPRPEVPEYVALWGEQERRIILSVRPGLSDPATIRFRREAELLAEVEDPERHYREHIVPEKVRAYVSYVESRSVRGDIRIAWHTVRETLFR